MDTYNRLKYKKYFVTVIFVLGYVYMHSMLTGIIRSMPLSDWVKFDVPLPFVQRLLVPVFIRGLQYFLPHTLSLQEWFLCVELLFAGLLFAALFFLLKKSFSSDQSLLLGWLFFLLLPLVQVVNFRYTLGGAANVYTPYDLPALFFCVAGFYLCLEARWVLFYSCLFLATLNRESAILLVLLVPILHGYRMKAMVWPMLISVFFFLLAKLILYCLLQDKPGSWVEFVDTNHGMTNLELNLRWLFSEQHNILALVFAFAGLPLLWFVLYDFIPESMRLLRYPLFAYFIGLLFVGKMAETRIFGEIVGLMYYPVCLAVKHWLLKTKPVMIPRSSADTVPGRLQNALYYVDRYFILSILVLMTFFSSFIIQYLNYFVGLK